MLSFNKKILVFFTIFSILFSFCFVTNTTLAQIGDTINEIKQDISKDGESYGYKLETNNMAILTAQIISIILSFVGLLFLVMIVISGIQWMTAGGDEEKITNSKVRIKNSIIGVAIIFSAWVIVLFLSYQINSIFTDPGDVYIPPIEIEEPSPL